MSSSQLYTGLEYMAAALIFLPEPTTTFIGVGLLGYARSQKNGEQSPQVVYRHRNRFRDVYTYSVEMRDGACINYKISGIKPGQMPRKSPNINNLESYRNLKTNKASALPQPKPFCGLQQGLLSNSVAGAGYANSVIARRSHKQKKST
jgi:hypothetical protein